MRWKVLLATVFAVLVAVFALINATPIRIHFLFATAKLSLVFVILFSLLIGMILMSLLWSTQTWKLRRENKALQRELEQAQSEANAFRNMAASEDVPQADSKTLHETTEPTANPDDATEPDAPLQDS